MVELVHVPVDASLWLYIVRQGPICATWRPLRTPHMAEDPRPETR